MRGTRAENYAECRVMAAPKYSLRRDNNESEVIRAAERIGWMFWIMHSPADWLALRRGVWHVVEIKNPDCEGRADEYTPQQKIFRRDVYARGGRVLVWRTVDDVIRDSN